MSEPFARFDLSVRVTLIHMGHLDFHLINADARHSVIRNVKVNSEGTKLLKLNFIDLDALFVSK